MSPGPDPATGISGAETGELQGHVDAARPQWHSPSLWLLSGLQHRVGAEPQCQLHLTSPGQSSSAFGAWGCGEGFIFLAGVLQSNLKYDSWAFYLHSEFSVDKIKQG